MSDLSKGEIGIFDKESFLYNCTKVGNFPGASKPSLVAELVRPLCTNHIDEPVCGTSVV